MMISVMRRCADTCGRCVSWPIQVARGMLHKFQMKGFSKTVVDPTRTMLAELGIHSSSEQLAKAWPTPSASKVRSSQHSTAADQCHL